MIFFINIICNSTYCLENQIYKSQKLMNHKLKSKLQLKEKMKKKRKN